jgi:hypothetical protein
VADCAIYCATQLATVCVEYETKRFDVCCRVNADEPGHESTAMEYLWAQISTFVLVVQQFLESWPGLFFKVGVEKLLSSWVADTSDVEYN